jgi:hypothetical protein
MNIKIKVVYKLTKTAVWKNVDSREAFVHHCSRKYSNYILHIFKAVIRLSLSSKINHFILRRNEGQICFDKNLFELSYRHAIVLS